MISFQIFSFLNYYIYYWNCIMNVNYFFCVDYFKVQSSIGGWIAWLEAACVLLPSSTEDGDSWALCCFIHHPYSGTLFCGLGILHWKEAGCGRYSKRMPLICLAQIIPLSSPSNLVLSKFLLDGLVTFSFSSEIFMILCTIELSHE